MKQLFLIALTSITLAAQAQTDNKIVIGKIDSVYSKVLKEQRKIWIYTPDMTSGNHDPAAKYPVLYLLDGDAHFQSVVGLIQQLSQVNGNSVLPEMIIVAIPNTDRTRDLTPTHILSDLPAMDTLFSKTTGGGENFVSFIEKELMPHLDSIYATAPYKLLVGHSFGGLTVMNVITNHPRLFNAYIAIDPSMWYDKERFLAVTKKKLAGAKFDRTKLYLGIANTMDEGMTLEKLKKDTSAGTRHIRSIFELDRFLKANAQSHLSYSSRYYKDDNHASVPLASEYDGLRYIFDYYKINITIRDFYDSTDAIVSKLTKHYGRVSTELGYKVSPPELFINSLGYTALGKKYYKRAAGLFKLNITNFPKSSNAYDSYGDLLNAENDIENAKINFKKALEIQDNIATRQKLNKLEGKAAFELTDQKLQQYTGAFVLDSLKVTITMHVKDKALWADVPGDGDQELVPVTTNVFSLKAASGYTVTFQMEGDKAVAFTSIQPNGTFIGRIKK